jgi:hypothetical protein
VKFSVAVVASTEDAPVDVRVGGALAGVALNEATDDADVPVAFVAVEVNVYEVPLLKPVIVQEPLDPLTVQVAPPGDAVTVYEVGTPPDVGGVVPVAGCETVTTA